VAQTVAIRPRGNELQQSHWLTELSLYTLGPVLKYSPEYVLKNVFKFSIKEVLVEDCRLYRKYDNYNKLYAVRIYNML
jgi:hypothetical protein